MAPAGNRHGYLALRVASRLERRVGPLGDIRILRAGDRNFVDGGDVVPGWRLDLAELVVPAYGRRSVGSPEIRTWRGRV